MKVTCISAGMLSPKKENHKHARKQRYLNYGLLSLASLLQEDTQVFHGGFEEPLSFLESLAPSLQECRVLLLSIPSFYALDWAQQFAFGLSKLLPDIAVHVGGRWVVDGNVTWLRQRFPEDVVFHESLGEIRLGEIACAADLNEPRAFHQISDLDYSRLNNLEAFNPSIEISRGCGMGCQFCQEADHPLSSLKCPTRLVAEAEQAANIFGYNPNFYFESSFFAPGQKWIEDLAKCRTDSFLPFVWRTETRADAIPPRRLPALYDAGLRYLDIGLESADPSQLLAMKKTRAPERYLSRARDLIEGCFQVGIKCKINVLLYPGETRTSLDNTRTWLEDLAEKVHGVSAYPVLLFGIGARQLAYQADFRAAGAVGFKPIGHEGVQGVDLSPEFSHQDAKREALALSRQFMTQEQYFDLKNFSYFDPRYCFDEFLKDTRDLPDCELPFRRGAQMVSVA